MIRKGGPSPATILFNRLIRGLLPKTNRIPIIYDYDVEHFEVLKWADTHNTGKDFTMILLGPVVVVYGKDDSPGTNGTVLEHGSKEHNKIHCWK